MKRIDTMSIRDILRHHHDLGLPRAEIAVAVSVSAGTVSNVLERAQAAGLSWPLPSDLDDDGLRARLYPPAPRESGYAQPDWDDVLRELRAKRKRRRVRATRRTLWEEYRDETQAQGGKAYSYSQFCARLKAHQGSCGGSAQMHFDYEPGLYGMADFSGKTLALRTGRGETDIEIFVAVLAHSNLIYAEAVPDQTVRHWTMAHRRALEYFGGTPRRWIIDNLKSGVDDPDRDDIRLNPSYREFARDYKIAVLPARQYRATDKGLVESCVKAVQTRILLALRHHTFFSLESMNAAIRRELDRLNDAPMAKHGESRRALFEANERAALTALPAHPWEWGEWVERKVGPNCHVRLEHNHYSVPERYIGRQVDVRAGERMVEVFLERGGERIAVHRRKAGRNQYATTPEHMPENHQAVCDIRRPDYGDILLDQARRIGTNALAWAERCYASRDFPEQAFATVQGMIRLADDHGAERLDVLCAEALDLNRLASGFLRERLKNGGGEPGRPRPEHDETIPSHGNIRGGGYYGNNEGATP